MADAVQSLLEDMVDELDDLKNRGIFSADEIRSIVKQRTRFEYALRRRQSMKEDYVRFVKYELQLDALRVKRKDRLGIVHCNVLSEFAIIRRVHFIFHRALKKFRGDVDLWLQYFDFCERSGSTKMLGKSYASAVKFNPTVSGLWIAAAKWEFESNLNVRSSRILLQRGLRVNRSSLLLWREYLRIEMLHLEKVVRRRLVLGVDDFQNEESRIMDPVPELELDTEKDCEREESETAVAGDDPQNIDGMKDFLKGKVVCIVLRSAVRTLGADAGLTFLLTALPVLRLFPPVLANPVLDYACELLREHFYDSSDAVSTLSRRSIDDMIAAKTAKASGLWLGKGDDAICERLFSSPDVVEDTAVNAFLASVSELPTVSMFEHALDFFAERIALCDMSDTVDAKRVSFLTTALLNTAEKALALRVISPHSLNVWISTLLSEGRVTDASLTLEIATDVSRSPSTAESLAVWTRRIQLTRTWDSEKQDFGFLKANEDDIFEHARANLCESDIPAIWKLQIDICLSSGRSEAEIDMLFRQALRSLKWKSGDADMRLRYIAWAEGVGGISHARSVYEGPECGETPVPLTVLRRCILLETTQTEPNVVRLRQLFEAACANSININENEVDVDCLENIWLDYITLESHHGSAVLAPKLYWRAMKSLNESASFISKYEEMRASIAVR